MNIISMYLPQFHKVKENDEWWGEGYTEWTAVKNADKLYDNHMQPKIPLDSNYYDLMDKSTMKWQTDLMHQYGIDGQCFYHYWFKDGKQILEKPAENLLRWSDIDMPFCFCWANDTWARTWSSIQEKTEWTVRYEKEGKRTGTGVLLEQQYGEKCDWRKHYEYLRIFFKDRRYIKNDGKPLFLIYKSRLITCIGEMLTNWNKWALEDGFNGIYVIGANTDIETEKYLDGILCHEPQCSIMRLAERKKIEDGVIKYCYKELWDTILSGNSFGKRTYYGGFVSYDDSPRRGKGGFIVEGSSPGLFREYLSRLIVKNSLEGNEYIFINAWNEWGEGMYLEPDIENKYSYLEAVKFARENYIKDIEKYKEFKKNRILALYEECSLYRKKVFQYEKYWKIFDLWMKNHEQKRSLANFLTKKHIRKVGIYGMGMMGRHLLSELSECKVNVLYAIDQRAEFIESPIIIYKPEDVIPAVDAIIITVLWGVEDIKYVIAKKIDCQIILLEKMIMDVAEDRIEI